MILKAHLKSAKFDQEYITLDTNLLEDYESIKLVQYLNSESDTVYVIRDVMFDHRSNDFIFNIYAVEFLKDTIVDCDCGISDIKFSLNYKVALTELTSINKINEFKINLSDKDLKDWWLDYMVGYRVEDVIYKRYDIAYRLDIVPPPPVPPKRCDWNSTN